MKTVAYAQPERQVAVSADGAIRVLEVWASGKREVWVGQISDDQLESLGRAFEGWQSLGDSYPSSIVPDGPEYSISYAGKTVRGGDLRPPEPFDRVRRNLSELASQAMRRGHVK